MLRQNLKVKYRVIRKLGDFKILFVLTKLSLVMFAYELYWFQSQSKVLVKCRFLLKILFINTLTTVCFSVI